MRRWLALFLVLPACNSVLGITDVTVADDAPPNRARTDAGDAPSDPGSSSSGDPGPGPDATTDGGADAGVADAGPLPPDPACVKAPVSLNAVLRVELDPNPAPVKNGTTITGRYSVYGNNAMSNVRIDFCTSEGLKADPGGGTTFLGGGGAETRRWQTNNDVTLPLGIVQAQVYADGSPSLKRTYDITLQ